MKILKKGKLPKDKLEFKFECSHCGMVALATRKEVSFVEDRGQDHPTIGCPTFGCGQVVYGRHVEEPWLKPVLEDAKKAHAKRPGWAKVDAR